MDGLEEADFLVFVWEWKDGSSANAAVLGSWSDQAGGQEAALEIQSVYSCSLEVMLILPACAIRVC